MPLRVVLVGDDRFGLRLQRFGQPLAGFGEDGVDERASGPFEDGLVRDGGGEELAGRSTEQGHLVALGAEQIADLGDRSQRVLRTINGKQNFHGSIISGQQSETTWERAQFSTGKGLPR